MDLLLSVTSYRVLVDGQYVGKTVRTDGVTSGGFNRLNIALADTTRRLRRIDVELGLGDDLILGSPGATGANTGTLYVGPNDTVMPIDVSNRLTIAVVGDSFSASTGASFNQNGFAPQLGYLLGGVEVDVRQIAIGGTGYQVDNGQYTYAQRAGDLAQAMADIMIFAGGINDGTSTGEQAAVLATLQAARAVQPNALFVVLGSWVGTSGPSATNLAIEAALAAGVAQFADANTVFVPVLTDPAGSWITAANAAVFGSTDNTHPGDVGHAYLARRLNVAIRAAIAAGKTTWTPFDLGASLLGFWDADYGVTAGSGVVSAWADRVAGYSAIQATGTAQPAFSAAGIGNRSALVFDGVDDNLGMASCPFPTGAAGSEIWVLCSSSSATLQRIVAYGGALQAGARTVSHMLNNQANAIEGDGTTAYTANDSNVGGFTGAHVVRGRFEPALVGASLDNDAITTIAAVANTGASQVRLGCSASGSNFFNGPISAVIVTGLLTDYQAACLYGYLKARGGL